MEFKSLKNIESNFRLIRICCALFAGLCAAVAVASVGFSYAFAERQRQKIYVLDGGRSLMVALSQDLSQNRPVEAREHVRRLLYFGKLIKDFGADVTFLLGARKATDLLGSCTQFG